MGLDVLYFGGYLDGDEVLDPAATTYVGGQPAKVTATGANLAILPAGVVGFFKNDKTEDTANAPQVNDAAQTSQQQATIVGGTNKIRMFKTGGTTLGGGIPLGTVAPYATPPTANGGTWLIGDNIFVNATGFWNNAAQAGGDASFGIVTRVVGSAASPDELQVYAFGLGRDV